MIADYDVAFLLFTDHVMTALAIDVESHYVKADGVRYVFCEIIDV